MKQEAHTQARLSYQGGDPSFCPLQVVRPLASYLASVSLSFPRAAKRIIKNTCITHSFMTATVWEVGKVGGQGPLSPASGGPRG